MASWSPSIEKHEKDSWAISLVSALQETIGVNIIIITITDLMGLSSRRNVSGRANTITRYQIVQCGSYRKNIFESRKSNNVSPATHCRIGMVLQSIA